MLRVRTCGVYKARQRSDKSNAHIVENSTKDKGKVTSSSNTGYVHHPQGRLSSALNLEALQHSGAPDRWLAKNVGGDMHRLLIWELARVIVVAVFGKRRVLP